MTTERTAYGMVVRCTYEEGTLSNCVMYANIVLSKALRSWRTTSSEPGNVGGINGSNRLMGLRRDRSPLPGVVSPPGFCSDVD